MSGRIEWDLLERRRLLANLAPTDLYLIDQDTRQRVDHPAPGTEVYVRATFSAEGVVAGTSVRISRLIQNATAFMDVIADASWQGQTTVEQNLFHWTVPPDDTTIKFTVDTENAVSETSESDNVRELTLESGTYVPATISPTALHSRPDASHAIYLDFNGHYATRFSTYERVTTPTYDTDGDPTSFSAAEQAEILEVWQRVSEDYAPFDIDVTTEAPSSGRYDKFQRISIGGDNADWHLNGRAAGVAGQSTFRGSATLEPGYVFLGDFSEGAAYPPRNLADAVSHEAAHTFGLDHQSSYDAQGTLTATYNVGADDWSPIMGAGYRDITTWYNGPTPSGVNSLQDDLAIIAESANGFGYRSDDVPSATSSARALGTLDEPLTFSGVVGRNSDVDTFSFVSTGGAATLSVSLAPSGPNLDAVLELRDASGALLQSSDPADRQTASLTANLPAGNYFAAVRSTGVYGRIGQYELNVSGASPEIEVADVTGTEIPLQNGTGTAGQFSAVVQGAASSPTRTFVVRNTGDAPLTLGTPTFPAGFVLTESLATTIEAGASDTFTVKLDTAAAGTFTGPVTLETNDADEAAFTFTLTGMVSALPPTIPSGPNLLAGAVTGKFPANVVGGGKATGASVRVDNTGDREAAGTVRVRLLVSADGNVDSSDREVASLDAKLKLKVGAGKVLKFSKFKAFPAGLPDGSYVLLAEVDGGQALAETNESDNVGSSATPIFIAAAFTDLTVAGPIIGLPATLTPGKKAAFSLPIQNDGNFDPKASVSVNVLLSSDGNLGDDRAVTTVSAKLSVAPGTTKSLKLNFIVPTDLPAGTTYMVAAVVTPAMPLTDRNPADNTGWSLTALAIR